MIYHQDHSKARQDPGSGPDPNPGPGPDWATEEEEGEGLTEFQRKMKKEHRQAMKNNNRGCVLLERHRRKRITQSCSRLRQLLPTMPGCRVDMVTVLETTVCFLEAIQQVSHLQLCPPVEVHSDWLLQSHMTKELGHKMAAEVATQIAD